MIRPTRRTYSKCLVAINSLLSWGLMYYGVYQHEAMYTVPGGFAFILGIGGYYMHVGHADLKATAEAISSAGKSDENSVPTITDPSGINEAQDVQSN